MYIQTMDQKCFRLTHTQPNEHLPNTVVYTDTLRAERSIETLTPFAQHTVNVIVNVMVKVTMERMRFHL